MDSLHAKVVESIALGSGHMLQRSSRRLQDRREGSPRAQMLGLHKRQLPNIVRVLHGIVAAALPARSSASLARRLGLVAFDVSLATSLAARACFLRLLVSS